MKNEPKRTINRNHKKSEPGIMTTKKEGGMKKDMKKVQKSNPKKQNRGPGIADEKKGGTREMKHIKSTIQQPDKREKQ